MKLYSDSPGRRTFQIISDLFLLCFVAVCVWVGREVTNGIGALRGPADGLTTAGNNFQQNMSTAATNVGNIPLVGDGLSTPFQSLSGTGQSLANVGVSLGNTVDAIAKVTGIAVAAVPIFLALCVWGFFRVRFVRKATAAARVAKSPGSMDLFALRALTRQPLRRLAALGPDVASRFRDGDPVVVRQLAILEMRSCGLNPGGPKERPRPLPRPA